MLLDQPPPVVASVYNVLVPIHTSVEPNIGVVATFTDITVVTVQPVPVVYVIEAVPMPTPVTTPVPVPIVIVASELLHNPPGVASYSIIVEPRHMNGGAVIATGTPVTVTSVDAAQPPAV